MRDTSPHTGAGSPATDAAHAPGGHCVNCGATLTGAWCAACGQKAHVARLSLKHLLHEIPHSIFHVDRGFVPTLKALVVRPGVVVDEYLAGKRARYFNPLTLLVICAGICGAAWAVFPFRPELFWPLAPQMNDHVFGTLVPFWFKVVGATQLLFLLFNAYVLYTVWAAALHRARVPEGRGAASWRISWFYLVGPSDARRLAPDPRYRLYGECVAAAAFVTAVSLLITAAFAPLFALATSATQYRWLIVLALLAASLPTLRLIQTSPLAPWNNTAEAIINAVFFAFGTPCGFLFYVMSVHWSMQLGAAMVRMS